MQRIQRPQQALRHVLDALRRCWDLAGQSVHSVELVLEEGETALEQASDGLPSRVLIRDCLEEATGLLAFLASYRSDLFGPDDREAQAIGQASLSVHWASSSGLLAISETDCELTGLTPVTGIRQGAVLPGASRSLVPC